MTHHSAPHGSPNVAGRSMGPHYHACGLFRNREEAYRVLIPFIEEGMARGERALHVTDPAWRGDHMLRLERAGVDTKRAEDDGQLDVLTWDQVYLKDGRFSLDAVFASFEQAIEANRDAGYSRTRIIGDMGWATENKPGVEQVMEYEARVNYTLTKFRQPAICAYDVSRLDAETMFNVLRTHPLVILGDTVSENPFFMPPDEFLRQMRNPQ